jgi:hypothetical protein
MYKQIKINNNFTIAFEKFKSSCKKISKVYKTGIQNWDSYDHNTYSLVIGSFRIMIYKNNHRLTGCN